MSFGDKIKSILAKFKKSASLSADAGEANLFGVVALVDELVSQRRVNYNILKAPSFKVSSVGAGAFRSPFRGRGMEFDEVRLYQAGDDVRTIDWRVSAKTGKTHTKLFHEERERPVHILTDLRPQMRFGTKGAFKSVVAARLSSMIGWAALENGDRIGGLIISSKKQVVFSPQRSRKTLMGMIKSLSQATKDDGKNKVKSLAQAVSDLRHVVRTGGMVFVISDFADYDEDLFKHLGMLSAKGDVACVHIYDVLEEKAPPAGMYRVSDGQDVSVINSADENWKNAFEEYFESQKKELEKFCHQRRISYIKIRTDEKDIGEALRNGLYTQKRRSLSISSIKSKDKGAMK
jgi:uncharacterized protein (DUF58 family)